CRRGSGARFRAAPPARPRTRNPCLWRRGPPPLRRARPSGPLLTRTSGRYVAPVRLRYSEEAEAFRRELCEWLEANVPRADDVMSAPKLSSAHIPPWARAWQRRLYDAGWLVPGWPPELGGRNATPVQQMVYFEEL